MSIFVDTGAFYALADANDEHHERAKAFTFDFHFSLFRSKTGTLFLVCPHE